MALADGCCVRHALAICLFIGIWFAVWSASWLGGAYLFQTDTPALFGGLVGCIAGALLAQLPLAYM